MNLGQIRSALQALGYTSDTAAAQNTFINSVYREVCGMQRWPFLEAQDTSLSTVVGQPSYSLAALNSNLWRNLDAVRLENVASMSYLNLNYIDPESFMAVWETDHDASSNATPHYWTFYAQKLWLYPQPDLVYVIRIDYIIEPADLANDSDIPVIPIQYHDVLVWGAAAQIAHRERDWLGREFAEQKKETLLRRLQEEYMVRQRQTSSHVKKSGYWDTSVPYPLIRGGF